MERPPRAELGDLAFPMFPFARDFKTSPPAIAGLVAESLGELKEGSVKIAGPYLNAFLDRAAVAEDLLKEVVSQGDDFGRSDLLEGQKVMVEFSCPNTNKPLHLGHLRNDAIGESISRILKAAGADVKKVNLINNRGVHICKSMLAYQKFGEGRTPENSGIKGDHLVGDFYVKFNQWSKEDDTAEEQAQQMLRQWEKGDPAVNELWETMNCWTIDGIKETYEKTGISFDTYYYESDTYLSGRDEVLKGLEKGVFYKDEDGSIRLDLSDIGMDTKLCSAATDLCLYDSGSGNGYCPA